eukprot:4016498-Ditylum_brightwellii.AAC.2
MTEVELPIVTFIKDLSKYEGIPNRQEPITNAMCIHINNLAQKSSLDSKVSEPSTTGLYGDAMAAHIVVNGVKQQKQSMNPSQIVQATKLGLSA